MTEHLFQTLVSLGHDVRIVERRFSRSVDAVGKFSLRKVASAAWMPVRLLAALTLHRTDVVIFFVTNRTFSFLVDVLLTGVLKATRTPRILYVHTSGWRRLGQRNVITRNLVRFVFRGSRAVVTLGARLRDDLCDVSGAIPTRFIANTTEVPNHFDASAASDETLRVRYISNLIQAKGVLDFIDIAESLIREGFRIDFRIYGATADRAFQMTVESRIAAVNSHQLSYGGPVADNLRMASVLRETDILVFPSTYEFEAQPLILVEAIAHGVVVAAYDVGGVADIVSRGHAFLVPPGRADQLAGFVRDMNNDRQSLERLAKGARAFFENSLGPTRFRDEWAAVLSEGTRRDRRNSE